MTKQFRIFKLFLIAAFIGAFVQAPAQSMENQARSSAESLQVDPHSGSASVSFPIIVAQGRAGIQPNLALSYNSNAKESISGYGWSLELGSVHRSTKNGVLSFSSADTYLLLQNGSTQEIRYDSPSATFQLKEEGSFMKIWQDNNAFHMKDRNGTYYLFGEDNTNREYDPNQTNHILKWNLNHVEDVHGNYMDITYLPDGNKQYPLKIEYTGNSQVPTLPFATIDFVYEDPRPDPQYSYVSGIKITTTKRLKEITVKANGVLQRKYILSYNISPATNRSLLTSVKQIGSDGVTEFPETVFSYEDNGSVGQKYSNVITYNANNTTGNNLWNYRKDTNFDRGHDNFGPCDPQTMCGQGVNWGSATTIGNGSGSMSFNGGSDQANYAWTYLFVNTNKNITVPLTAGESVVGVFVNGVLQANPQTWNLKAGYNLVEITAHHQHEGFSFNLNKNIATSGEVQLVNTTRITSSAYSGDVNGDGLTDIITKNANGDVLVDISTGSAFIPTETWITNFVTDDVLLLGDFNGDGLSDITTYRNTDGHWKMAYSNGTGFDFQGTLFADASFSGQPSVGDFNGDGWVDIFTFRKISGEWRTKVAINLKNSTFEYNDKFGYRVGLDDTTIPFTGNFNGDSVIDLGTFDQDTGKWTFRMGTGGGNWPFDDIPDILNFGTNKNIIIADFNADNLTDIGYYDPTTGEIFCRVANGSGFTNQHPLPFTFSLGSPSTQVSANDYNGDGMADWIASTEVGDIEMAYSQVKIPDLLTQVDNSIGGIQSIEYKPSTIFTNTFLPFPVSVVRSTTTSDSRGSQYVSTYEYANGLWDAAEREFRGFGMVKTIDPDGNYSESTFNQDSLFHGRPQEQKSFDSNDTLFAKTVYTWDSKPIATGVDFVFLKRKDNFVLDGQATGRRTAEEFIYGETPQLGNLTKAIQYGEVDFVTGTDIGSDKRTVETFYVKNTTKNLLGLPRTTLVRNNGNTVVRQTLFYYDNQGNTATPVKGLLWKKEDLNGATNPKPATFYTYDVYGNLLTTKDPLNNITTISYDTDVHMFPLTTTNALGHQVVNEYYGINGVSQNSAGYRGLWGQLRSTTDPNNQEGERVYDVFGRLVKSISPLDSLSLPTTEIQRAFFNNYLRTTTKQRINHGEAAVISTVTFTDGLGRVIQSKAKAGEVGQFIIAGQTQYNNRGQVEKQYLPFFTTSSINSINPINANNPHSTVTYDAMGRVIQTTNPDGTYASVEYNQWTTRAINENGHMQESNFDAYGRLIRKHEYTGADGRSPHYPSVNYVPYATTQYQYDSEGNLTKTIDAKNNQTVITYNNLGQKISMNDPDMGVWNYEYDLNGNLSKQTDAKGQVITFTYDALNRLVNKTDGGSLNVNYNYDVATMNNSKGRLNQAAYSGGDTQFDYDPLGREIESIKRINNTDYSVQRGYDAVNRLLNVEYPDGEKIFYQYNDAGQIKAISNDVLILPQSALGVEKSHQVAKSQSRREIPLAVASDQISESHNVTMSQGHKVTRSQSQQVAKSQSHKVTKLPFIIDTSNEPFDFAQDKQQALRLRSGQATSNQQQATKPFLSQLLEHLSNFFVTPAYAQSNAYLWEEAENADSLSSQFQIINEASASNGQHTFTSNTIPSNYAVNPAMVATYSFQVPSTGNYVVWGRCLNTFEDDDSFYIQMDSGTIHTWDIAQVGGYHWDQVSSRGGADPVVFNLSAGTHTLKVYVRETGTKLDRILLTNDLTFTPTGLGEDPGAGSSDTQAPSVPAGLSFTNKTQTSMQLNWNASTDNVGVSGYRVDVATNSTFSSMVAGFNNLNVGNVTAKNITGLTAGTTYYARVRAFDAAANTSASSVTVSASTNSAPPSNNTPGTIWIEAEAADTIVAPFQIDADVNASSGEFASVPNGNQDQNPPGNVMLTYNIMIPETGDYVIWGRTISFAILDDSFFVQVDNGTDYLWDTEPSANWNWDQVNNRNGADPVIFHLTAGAHTLKIKERETGTLIDKILITNDLTYVPSGLGESGGSSADTQAPSVPTGLSFTNKTETSMTLNWNASTDNVGVSGYRVDVATNSTFTSMVTGFNNLNVGNVTSKNITGLTAGTTYYARVRAFDAAANTSASSATVSASTNSAPQSNNTPGTIWIEAEAFDTIKAPFQTATDANASGGVYVYSPNGQYEQWSPGSVETTYTLDIAQTGDYVIWGRVIGATGNDDSFYVQIDGGSDYLWSVEINSTWIWDQVSSFGGADPVVFHLTAGIHTLHVKQRENGVKIDKLVVTNDLTLVPSGLGGSNSSTAAATLFIKDVKYNASGQITRVEYGNGVVTNYTFNTLNLRLERMLTTDAQGVKLQDLNYTYDSAGNILGITDAVHTATQTFQYDALNRLKKAVGNYGTKNYAYDQIGNIIQKDGKTYTYGAGTAGPHAVTSLSDGSSFQYDANGNMIVRSESGVTTEYGYDVENRLVSVKENSATKVLYQYDGDGGRTQMTISASSKTTTFVGSLYESDGSRATSHVFLGDTRVASITNGQIVYVHGDHLGGANVITAADGVIKELIEYKPFGAKSVHEKYGSGEAIAWHYFTGQRLDDEVGLYYYGARYYDPSLGRFITADGIVQNPVGDPQTFNRYSYVGNNPIIRIDPSGHFWFVAAIVAAVKGAVIGATIGATTAAITGGDIGRGALFGAIGGAAFAGFGSLTQSAFRIATVPGGIGPMTSGATFAADLAGGIIGGAAGGAASAAYLGSDPLSGAGIGALSGGLFGQVSKMRGTGWPGVGRVAAAGIAGGLVSEVAGGSFIDGFAFAGTVAGADFIYRAIVSTQPGAEDIGSTTKTARHPGKYKMGFDENGNEKLLRVLNVDKHLRSNTGIPSFLGETGNAFSQHFWASETGAVMNFMAKYIPGINGMSYAHDVSGHFLTSTFGKSINGKFFNFQTMPIYYGVNNIGAAINDFPALIGIYNVYGE
ncbi:MAG: fibronectin type III domain-containing protein [Candidatus Omnitrophica bacterium]|nr:fibronectin type III domain-containing protein [Candidatus Omnitrophota bacterium]